MLEAGLLLMRVVVGALLLGHGLQKLAGWFGGPGIEGNRQMLAQLGYRWPAAMSWAHGAAEAVAGALLVLGLLTPVAGALLIAVMVNAAVAVHAPNGLWVQNGGIEYPLVLAVLGATYALTGPGAVAIDTALGLEPTPVAAIAAIVVGLVLGAGALGLRQSAPGATSEQERERESLHAA